MREVVLLAWTVCWSVKAVCGEEHKESRATKGAGYVVEREMYERCHQYQCSM